MTNLAVKTNERANEILTAWAKRSCVTDEQGWEIDNKTTIDCECGETVCFRASVWDLNSRVCDHIAFVAVCDSCGDDDYFETDVLIEK